MDSVANLMPDARFVCRTYGRKDALNLSTAEFTALHSDDLLPVTTIPAWLGKKSYEGRWWLSRPAGDVAFASGWERDVLIFLDYRGDVEGLVRDPVIVIPARPARTPPIRPWLLIETTAGARLMLLSRADTERTPELATILAGHNVGVAVITLPRPDEMRRIRWLAGYRFSRFVLAPDIERRIRQCCHAGSSISTTVAAAVSAIPCGESTVRANIYSQLWRRTITLMNPHAAIADTTEVVAA